MKYLIYGVFQAFASSNICIIFLLLDFFLCLSLSTLVSSLICELVEYVKKHNRVVFIINFVYNKFVAEITTTESV